MAWQAIVKFAVQVVGSYLISSLLTPSVRQTGSRLEDKSVQTSTYGASIPRIYGTCAVTGNVIWLKGNQLFDISVTAKGKKTSIGGSRSRTTVFPVFATFAVGLCEGPIAGIRRLWIGSDLVYDAGSDDIETIIASNQRVGGDPLAELPQNIVFKGDVSSISERLPPWTFKIFYGTEDQEPSIAQEADKGAGNVPAYRGIAYIEIYNLPLEKYGNSLAGAQVKAEIVKSATFSNHAIQNIIIPPADGSSPTFPGNLVYVDDDMIYTVQRPKWNSFYTSPGTMELSRYHSSGHIEDSLDVITNQREPLHGLSDRHEYVISADIAATVISSEGLWRISNSGGNSVFERKGDFLYVLYVSSPIRIMKCKQVLTRTAAANSSVIYSTDTLTNPDAHAAQNRKNFCVSDTHVYLLGDSLIYAYSISDMSLDYTVAYSRPSTIHACVFRDGLIRAWFEINSSSGRLASIDPVTGVFEHSDIVPYSSSMTSVPENAILEYKSGTFILSYTRSYSFSNPGTHIMTFQIGRITPGTVALSSVVSEEVQLSNYISASDIDVTDLTDDVRGYRITDTGSIRSSLEPLQAVWPFDVYQSGYKLKFVRRGNASVVSIPASKLDARPYGAAPGTELTIEREMDSQLPREVALKHLDAQREYDIGEQRAERKTTDSINKIELEIPVSLTATEAAQAVEVMLWMAWGDRHNVSFSLPPEYGNLEPTDVITITGQWGVYTLRLGDVDYKTDGRVVCTNAKFESAASYVSTAIGSESGVNEQTLGLSGPSFYQLLDIPMIADEFDGLGTLAAMAGYTSGWPGGLLYRSSDNGATWEDVLGFQNAVTVGFATNSISTGRTDIRDFTNALECSFIGPVPASISYASLLDWGNVFAYGAHGRWEIIGVQTVTAITGGYRLTNLLRGMFGTEWAMGTHVAGDKIVLLSTTAIQWLAFTAVDETKPFLGITSDRDLDTGTQADFTYEGVNLTPLSPVYLNGNRHPSTNDWTLTWLRRFRYSLQFADTIGTPADEDTASFEIDVFSDNTYATVLRTIAVTASTATYTSAQQVTDFGSNQSTLYLEVYAISATVGRGYALRTSITR